MSTRGETLSWFVFAAVLVAAGAAYARVAPHWDFEDSGALGLGMVVLFATVWGAMRLARHHREVRARRVSELDLAMRSVAAQTGDEYFAGGAYQHPMIETIRYPGRLCGNRGPRRYELCFAEDEDGAELRVSAEPVAGRKGRLTPRAETLSLPARDRVRALLAQGNRVAVREQYETLRKLLLKELGVEPSAETQRAYKELLK